MKKLCLMLFFLSSVSCVKDPEPDISKEDLSDFVEQLGLEKSKSIFKNEIEVFNSIEPKSFSDLASAKEYVQKLIPRGKSFSGKVNTPVDLSDTVYAKFNGSGSNALSKDRHQNGGDLVCGRGNVVISTRSWGTDFNVNIAWSRTGDFNFDSYLSGFVLGVSYDHISANSWDVGGTVHFNVHGLLHYNLILEGVGRVFSERILLSGSYDTCNGNYVINYY